MDGMAARAGYPVLRLLATGVRSRVWLIDGGRVVKVPGLGAGSSRVPAEAEALHRARGEHVVELLDVSGDADELGLVFPRLPRGSLANVLESRDALDAGEAVTVLVPIAGALSRMHAAGVAHGALGAESILFADDGAPVLTGFGSAVLFEPGLPEVRREQVEAVIADRAALAALARAVLTRVGGPRTAVARDLADRVLEPPWVELEARLTRELFELAAARPVGLEAVPAEDARLTRTVPIGEVPVVGPATPERRRLPPMVAGPLTAVLESGPASLLMREVRRRWAGASPARRRALLAAGSGALVLTMVWAIPAAEPRVEPEAAEPSRPVVTDAIGRGDDPLAAVQELLDRRATCVRELSVLCLAEVDQDGSAASEQDRAWLDAVHDQGDDVPVISAEGAQVIERLGDSVLIALAPGSDPASVMLMRTEAGWRIRAYLAAVPGE